MLKVPRLVLLLTLVVTATAFAKGGSSERMITANLDGDDASERVVVREVTRGGGFQVDLIDNCLGSDVRTSLLPRPEGSIDRLVAREIDGDPSRKEVVIEGSNGATDDFGSGGVVNFTNAANGCAQAHWLFSFGPGETHTRKPKGAAYHTVGRVTALQLRRRADYPGLELRFTEKWYTNSNNACCPSFTSSIYLRYDSKAKTYVKYRSKIRRSYDG